MNQSLEVVEAELGKPVPKGWEWAEPGLQKMTAEFRQVRSHVPELLDAFRANNGGVILAQGGETTFLRTHNVNRDGKATAIAVAYDYRSATGMRVSKLIFDSAKYPSADQAVYGNIVAHELGHNGDVQRGLSDTARLSPGLQVSQPRHGHHSETPLFELCHELDKVLFPEGRVAVRAKDVASAYAQNKHLYEALANAVAEQGTSKYSPLSGHYVRTIFRYDMGLKAEQNDAMRSRFQSSGALTARYSKIVGDELKPLFDRWQTAKQTLADASPNDPKLGELQQTLDMIETEMRTPETATKIRLAVTKYLDETRLQAELEEARLERMRSQSSAKAPTRPSSGAKPGPHSHGLRGELIDPLTGERIAGTADDPLGKIRWEQEQAAKVSANSSNPKPSAQNDQFDQLLRNNPAQTKQGLAAETLVVTTGENTTTSAGAVTPDAFSVNAMRNLGIYGGFKGMLDPHATTGSQITGAGMLTFSSAEVATEALGYTRGLHLASKGNALLMPVVSGQVSVEHFRQGDIAGGTLHGVQSASAAAAAYQALAPVTFANRATTATRVLGRAFVPLAIVTESYGIVNNSRQLNSLQADIDRMNSENNASFESLANHRLNLDTVQSYTNAYYTANAEGMLIAKVSPLDIPANLKAHERLSAIPGEAKRVLDIAVSDEPDSLAIGISKLRQHYGKQKEVVLEKIRQHPAVTEEGFTPEYGELEHYDTRQKYRQRNQAYIGVWENNVAGVFSERVSKLKALDTLLDELDGVDSNLQRMNGATQDLFGGDNLPLQLAYSQHWKDLTAMRNSYRASAKDAGVLRKQVDDFAITVGAGEPSFDSLHDLAVSVGGRSSPPAYRQYKNARTEAGFRQSQFGLAADGEKPVREIEFLYARAAELNALPAARVETLQFAANAIAAASRSNADLQKELLAVAGSVKTPPVPDAEAQKKQAAYQDAISSYSALPEDAPAQSLLQAQLVLLEKEKAYLVHAQDAFEKQRYRESNLALKPAAPKPTQPAVVLPQRNGLPDALRVPPDSLITYQLHDPVSKNVVVFNSQEQADAEKLKKELKAIGVWAEYDPQTGTLSISRQDVRQYAERNAKTASVDKDGAVQIMMPSGKSVSFPAINEPLASVKGTRQRSSTVVLDGKELTVDLPVSPIAIPSGNDIAANTVPFMPTEAGNAPKRKR